MINLHGDESTGFEIVVKSFEAPVRQIADNAGLPGEVVVEKVKEQKAKALASML